MIEISSYSFEHAEPWFKSLPGRVFGPIQKKLSRLQRLKLIARLSFESNLSNLSRFMLFILQLYIYKHKHTWKGINQ